ncbi:MAG: ArsR family transcriptional regulator, partial [Planctomycetota bacterium]|nr:ArsR family transcriptional regulator [Planctomycetota bacterium]
MSDGIDLKILAKFFRGLGDESRLDILEALRKGPRNVTEIVQSVGLS